MVANQTACSQLEQTSIVKFMTAEKWKPYEIYQTMCDAYVEICFSKENYVWSKHGLPPGACIEKTVYVVEPQLLSDKEKVSGTTVVKTFMQIVFFFVTWRTYHDWFPWKSYIYKPVILITES